MCELRAVNKGLCVQVNWQLCLRQNLSSLGMRRFFFFGMVASLGTLLAGCAAGTVHQRGSREVDPKYGVAPSERVVEEGAYVPHGGGQYLVGRPYKIAGKMYYPQEVSRYNAVGTASWYGAAFQGRRTANGEIFNRNSISAAHPTLPLPSYVRVTNVQNHRSMVVRVNDRGPYHGGRVMDVSQRVADALDFRRAGTAQIKVEYLGKAGLAGSDDERLYATLRTDGPAKLDPGASYLVADNQPVPRAPAQSAAAPAVNPAIYAREDISNPHADDSSWPTAPRETHYEPPVAQAAPEPTQTAQVVQTAQPQTVQSQAIQSQIVQSQTVQSQTVQAPPLLPASLVKPLPEVGPAPPARPFDMSAAAPPAVVRPAVQVARKTGPRLVWQTGPGGGNGLGGKNAAVN